jgi:hypothetical protein
VKVHEASQILFSAPKLTPPLQCEDALDEILSQTWIVEAAFLLHGYEGKMVHEGPRKHPDAFLFSHPFLVVDFDPFHAAARRVTLENEAAKLLLFKLLDAFLGPCQHSVCVIHMGADSEETGRRKITHEAHGFPR